MDTSNQGLDPPPSRNTGDRYRPPSWTSENPSIQKALGCSGQIEMIWKPARVGMGRDGPDKFVQFVGRDGPDKMSSLWAEMARTRCPVGGPRWPGQDVQFVGRDGPDKMSSLLAEMARTRCPVCGPRWPGQDVQLWAEFVGRDGPDKMSRLVLAEMARTRCPIGEPRWLGQDVHFFVRYPPQPTHLRDVLVVLSTSLPESTFAPDRSRCWMGSYRSP